jgi:hypothetical protein
MDEWAQLREELAQAEQDADAEDLARIHGRLADKYFQDKEDEMANFHARRARLCKVQILGRKINETKYAMAKAFIQGDRTGFDHFWNNEMKALIDQLKALQYTQWDAEIKEFMQYKEQLLKVPKWQKFV